MSFIWDAELVILNVILQACLTYRCFVFIYLFIYVFMLFNLLLIRQNNNVKVTSSFIMYIYIEKKQKK